MRKSAKIFSVILCLALLVGAIMMTVSADVTPKTDLIPNGAEMVGVSGFTKYDIWTTASSINSMDKITIGGKEKGVIESGNWGTGGYAPKIETSEANGNTYFVRRHSVSEYGVPVHSNGNGPYDGFKMGNGDVAYNTASDRTDTDGTYADFSLMHFDYVTVDFDLASDMYLNSEGKLTNENTGKLAYLDGSYLGFLARDKSGQQQSGWQSVKIVYANNTWYLQKDKDTTTRAPLSANVGEWNHLTFVFKINTVVGGTEEAPTYKFNTSRCYLYVNGEYFFDMGWSGAKEMDLATAETYGFDSIRFNYTRSATKVDGGYEGSHITEFSTLSDNLSVNYYKKGYTGDLASFIAKDPTASIASCNDIVFSPEYQFELPNNPVAAVESKGVSRNYYSLNGALSAIEEGCTLTLYGDTKVENYVAFCDFTVVCDEGEFTLGQCQKVANRTSSGYEITKAKSTQQFTVEYYPSYDDAAAGTNEIVMEGDQNTATVNQPIFIPSLSAGTIGKVTDSGAEYKLLTKWQLFYYDGDDEVYIDLTPETTINDATLAVINSNNEGLVCAYPVYETMFLKYTITDANGELVADENGNYAYMADNTGLDDIIEKILLANNDITVTLYSDVKTTKPASITVGAQTVRFDLNGYSYYMTSNYKSTLFAIAQGTKLYIYSSQPGGEILSSSYVNKALSTGYLCSGSYAKQYVQLGAYDADGDGKKEIPGDNLGIHMGVLVDFTHATGTVSDADRNEVIIDGGIYTRTRDAGGFFVVRNQNTYIEFKNATYYDYSGAFIYTGDSGTYANCKTTAIIDNSKIYCSAGLFSFGTNVGSTITFTNSVIYGALTNANKGNPQDPSRVIIGEGNTLTQDIKTLGTAVTLAGNCEYYAPLNNEYTAKISMYKFIYNATDVEGVYELDWNSYTNKIENTVTATITAITASTDSDNLITLNMIDQDGKPIGTTHFPAGTAPSVTAIPEIDLDNPFFNIGFDKWVDENGNEFDFTACEAGKTYTAKATMKIVADFDGAFMNVVASIKFQPFVFVPVPDPEGYDGYEVVLGKTTPKITHYNGQAYYSFAISSFPTPSDTGSADSFTMDYTVNGVPLSATVKTYDLPTYFEKAAELSDESGKKLIIAVVNFCNEARRIAKNSTYARYDALLEKYADLVPKIESYNVDIAEDADRVDFSKLAPYVNASYATTSSMMPFFALSPANGVAIYPNLSEGTQYYVYPGGGNVSYSVEQFKGDSKYSVNLYENAATYADPYGNGSFGQKYGTQISGGSFLYQFSTNVPAYLLGNDMEITVRIVPASAITVTEDGDKKTAAIDNKAVEHIKGTYNLATYIEGLRAIAEPTVAEQNALEFAEALYMYYALAVEFQTTAEGN